MSILGKRKEYGKYYGNFRGVDFSSDHTQVHEQRLPFAVNMYKDYQSGQGQCIETIPGFRRRVVIDGNPTIHGIYQYKDKILIHAGTKLYYWITYPLSVGVAHKVSLIRQEGGNQLDEHAEHITAVYDKDGIEVPAGCYSIDYDKVLTFHEQSNAVAVDEAFSVEYYEGTMNDLLVIYDGLRDAQSTAFSFFVDGDPHFFLLDGEHFIDYDADEPAGSVTDTGYIPSTYIKTVNNNGGEPYEQRNHVQPAFRHYFVGDGETTTFVLNEAFDSIVSVRVDGQYVTGYTAGYDEATKSWQVTLPQAPASDIDRLGAEGYKGNVEVTAYRALNSADMILGCTIATIYDGRVFLSGNPAYPNTVFYSGMDATTGKISPTYFGVLNQMDDGVGSSPITGMLTVADTLLVLTSDSQQEGSTFFHRPLETGKDIQPVTYPSEQGLAGIGCIGACINFLDDPVFVSRLGIEAIGQLSVRLERAKEHRSSLIDAKLVNLDLAHAKMCEWNGYLLVLVEGQVFMADSRQRYAHESGVMQYEWYYLDGIGVWDGQEDEYVFPNELYNLGETVRYCMACHNDYKKCTCEEGGDDIRTIAIQMATDFTLPIVPHTGDSFEYTVEEDELTDGVTAYQVESTGAKVGGHFRKATTICSIYDNIFFGTANGVVCSFNFDKRDADGIIPAQYYSFDGRTIVCGVATKMDNCGVPHLNKSTSPKSTVIKTKSFRTSSAKIKVRTNNTPYRQVARINSALFSFEDMDFRDLSFNTTEQSLFSVNEKERKWVEKQYYIYSNEHCKPFALFYVTYQYSVVGKYKS